jgi:hypothetical protein
MKLLVHVDGIQLAAIAFSLSLMGYAVATYYIERWLR